LGECGPCPVLASYTLAFALQLRKYIERVYRRDVILASEWREKFNRL